MKNMKKKSLLALVLVALLLAVAVGSTLAYLEDKSGTVENSFTSAKVEVSVSGDKIVSSSADDNVDAYVRAAVLVNWEDSSGNVYGQPPAQGTDYELNVNSGWTKEDIYYYYGQKVKKGATISEPATVTAKTTAPEGFSLAVDIHVQAIQAEGLGASDAQAAFEKAAE